MPDAPPNAATSPNDPSPRRKRPVRGPLAAGLISFVICIAIGATFAAIVWFLAGNREYAQLFLVRFAAFGVAVGLSGALARWLYLTCSGTGAATHTGKREWPGAIAMILGLVLTGYLAASSELDSEDSDLRPAIGETVELAGPTLTGGKFDLAEQRGKVVLVDYWATWCGPCVGELPNVTAAYDKYHQQGLEVVAVSLDEERSDLEKFVQAHAEPWPQIIFDKPGERGFENPLAKKYHVQSIPYMLIVGRDGKLLARGVRGSGIEAAVTEALGIPIPWSARLADLGWRLLGWLIYALFAAPIWMLIVGVVGCSLGLTLVDLLVRRILGRSQPSSP